MFGRRMHIRDELREYCENMLGEKRNVDRTEINNPGDPWPTTHLNLNKYYFKADFITRRYRALYG